jgi:phosphohistidine phosphatase
MIKKLLHQIQNGYTRSNMKQPEYFYHQSGVIPYRIIKGKIFILLITSRSKGHWIIPKGIIETGLSPEKSALKEAIEEAGILGEIIGDVVARYDVTKWEDVCHVQLYLMKVTEIFDIWEEQDFRKRQWVELKAVPKIVKKKKLRKIFKTLKKDPNNFSDKLLPF